MWSVLFLVIILLLAYGGGSAHADMDNGRPYAGFALALWITGIVAWWIIWMIWVF